MKSRFLFAMFCGAMIFAQQAVAQPSAASQAIEFAAQVKEDAGKDLRLDWVNFMALYGEHLFVTSHRDGRLNVFKRDAATAAPRFCGFVDLAVQLKFPHRHLDAFPVLGAKNILYVSGMWTHAGSDRDSLGLSWYRFDPKDGSTRVLGTTACNAGQILPAPGGRRLYLAAAFSKALYTVELDAATGAPTIGAKLTGRGIGGLCLVLPGGKQLYSSDGRAIAWVDIAADGSLSYGGFCDLGPLDPRPTRSSAIAVSPDGKHAYVALWTYGYNALGLFSRNEQSGALTFVKKLAVDPNMVGINQIVFTADGKTGYYTSDPENSGQCLGWFTRDASNGGLRFGGVAEKSKIGPNHFAFAADTGIIYMAGNANTKYFNIYRTKP